MPAQSPHPRFGVEVRPTEHGASLEVHGELDADTRSDFIAAVDEVAGDVDVDTTGVSFLDSSGLAALVIAADRTRRAGAGFRIVAMSDTVQALLARTGLLEHLSGTAPDR